MKQKIISALMLISMLSAMTAYGQVIFRPIDPNDRGDRYGKSPYDGPPFLHFGSTSYQYHTDNSEYDDFEDEVEAAFDSWNNAGPVQFSKSSSSGLPLLGEARNPDSDGPAWSLTDLNPGTNQINPAGSYLTLNTNYTWAVQQNLGQGILDVQTMVVHEAGHIHGLAHPLTNSYTHDATAPTMAGGDNEYFDNTLDTRSLETDDINGTRFLQLRVPALYSNLQTALNVASQIGIGYVYLTSSYTLTVDVTIPSDATLYLDNSSSLDLNSHSIVSSGGTITVASGATITGLSAYLKNNSEEIKGLYPQIQTACDNASDYDIVEIQTFGTYNEDITIENKDYLTIKGKTTSDPYSTPYIEGDINIYYSEQPTLHSFICNSIYIHSCADPIIGGDVWGSGSGYGVYTYYSPYFERKAGYMWNFGGGLGSYFSNGQINFGAQLYENQTAVNAAYYSDIYPNGAEFCGSINYDLVAGTGSYILAQYCYYDNGIPRTQGNVITGGAEYDCNSLSASKELSVNNAPSVFSDHVEIESEDPALKEYQQLTEAYFDLAGRVSDDISSQRTFVEEKFRQEYQELIDNYKTYAARYPDSDLAKSALVNAVHCFRRLEDYDEMQTYLSKIKDDTELQSLGDFATRLMITSYRDKREYEQALKTADQVINNTKNGELVADALFEKGCIYAHDLNNPSKASETFATIVNDYPDNIMADFAKRELKLLGYDDTRQAFQSEGETEVSALKDLEFGSGSHPNPFNPTTTIEYVIPEAGNVVIKVYDILGREVAELVNEARPAGKHAVIFNASSLSSGVYFYTVNSGRYRQTKKMLLVK